MTELCTKKCAAESKTKNVGFYCVSSESHFGLFQVGSLLYKFFEFLLYERQLIQSNASLDTFMGVLSLYWILGSGLRLIGPSFYPRGYTDFSVKICKWHRGI